MEGIMKISSIIILADALKEYFDYQELQGIASLFDIEFQDEESNYSGKPLCFDIAKRMVTEIEHGNNRLFLETIIPHIFTRNDEYYAKSSFERRDYHGEMRNRLHELHELLDQSHIPREVTVTEQKPFTAKSAVREFLESVSTELIVVDNYIGIGTLDCLRGVQYSIKLLTGTHNTSIAPGFDSSLKEFIAEGHSIQVRRHPKLHDRYLIFNERCWLIGSSLKDAGKKDFSMIEAVDSKSAIVGMVENKWEEASPLQDA
jgi:hypothetical protein